MTDPPIWQKLWKKVMYFFQTRRLFSIFQPRIDSEWLETHFNFKRVFEMYNED